ncbi:MAG TPA: DUF6531 domain-containing protein [Solirubrobacteraceae bacterium]|jgi:hypothetical protein|nr:DUF6531 domain-containing protein [Solirubrobacteraceae bacterium]
MNGARRLTVSLLCCVAGLVVPPATTLGASSSPEGSSHSASAVGTYSPLGAPLVVPGSPTEGEQLQAGEEASRTTPEAAQLREDSESAYEDLSVQAGKALTASTDPGLVKDTVGGPPALPEGERIVGFPTDFAMSVNGEDGSREVRETLEPVALEVAPGRHVPIDLNLSEVNGTFEPKSALAPVRIPKHLGEGAALSEAGVSLTPTDEYGSPLPGEGTLDGASVFYADSEDPGAGVLDLDTLVKPSTFGLMIETSLRSQRSPSHLFFKVGLPAGAALKQDAPGAGPVDVVQGARKLAVILAPSAHDAAGTPVPVSMTATGDTLVLQVDHPAGAYAYPIIVDPRYEYYASEFTWDKQVNKSGSHATNWHFEHEGSLFTGAEGAQGWTIQVASNHGERERGWMAYTTQGLSHIWDFASETAQREAGTHVESRVELDSKGGVESEHALSSEVSEPAVNIPPYCRMGEKCLTTPQDNNSATYVALASGAGTGKAGEDILHSAEVAVQQEVNPEVSFDTTDATVNGHPNALYGTKNWLGPHSNALVKFTAADKGIGIEAWSSEHTNATAGWEHLGEKSLLSEGLCTGGIQCPSEDTEYIGYSASLPDGEPSLGLDAWNAMYDSHVKENEAEGSRRHVVRVDSTPPGKLAITGLPGGNEISAGGEYHLTVEATDGSATTPGSGVKSIALLIDGKEVGTPSGSCEVAKGPCTAHAEFTISGSSYATGKHTILVVATDNAGDVSTPGGETIFSVNPGASERLGPGSLNLASGQFSLGATDVALGGGLTVARTYASRALGAAGLAGPFGAQWGLSLGGQEALVQQPNESMVLTTASGAQTTFAGSRKSGFESPKGDANLTLSFEEPEGTKQYVLKDAATATSTTFRMPAGGTGEVWTPSITKGAAPTDTVTYSDETTTVEGAQITRPTEALAPIPTGVTCPSNPKELKPGCQALEFVYATEKTAKGESESEWANTPAA